MADPQQAGKAERAVDDHGPGHVGRYRGTLVGKKLPPEQRRNAGRVQNLRQTQSC